MPRRRDDASPLRDLLSDVLGSAFDIFTERAAEAAPRCCLCEEVAIPLVRCVCGHFACKDHGYFNVIEARVICPCCAAKLGAGEQPRAQRPPDWAAWQRTAQPQRRRARPQRKVMSAATAWGLLGLDPATATEADVNKAFRQMAPGCHPDRHPGDAAAAKRFRGLQAAKEACLLDLASREG